MSLKLTDITQWNVCVVVFGSSQSGSHLGIITEKFNYFMTSLRGTSLRGKNEFQVKFENSMHNYNATLVHWHHTLGCQCSSFGTYAAPVRVLITYFMTSLWGKNEVEVKIENSMPNYNVTLVHWHHKLGYQCMSFGIHAVNNQNVTDGQTEIVILVFGLVTRNCHTKDIRTMRRRRAKS